MYRLVPEQRFHYLVQLAPCKSIFFLGRVLLCVVQGSVRVFGHILPASTKVYALYAPLDFVSLKIEALGEDTDRSHAKPNETPLGPKQILTAIYGEIDEEDNDLSTSFYDDDDLGEGDVLFLLKPFDQDIVSWDNGLAVAGLLPSWQRAGRKHAGLSPDCPSMPAFVEVLPRILKRKASRSLPEGNGPEAEASLFQTLHIPQKWMAIVDGVAGGSDEQGDLVFPSEPQFADVLLVCGFRGTGKSTFCRFALNSMLNRMKRVAYLECDVSQTEFTPPGMVSLVDVTEPLFGPSYTHLREPVRSYFIGTNNPQADPVQYLQAIALAYKYYCDHLRTQGVPLVVNTPGWVQGLGRDLLLHIIAITSPTHIVQLMSGRPTRDMAPLTLDTLLPSSDSIIFHQFLNNNGSSTMMTQSPDIHVVRSRLYGDTDIEATQQLQRLNPTGSAAASDAFKQLRTITFFAKQMDLMPHLFSSSLSPSSSSQGHHHESSSEEQTAAGELSEQASTGGLGQGEMRSSDQAGASLRRQGDGLSEQASFGAGSEGSTNNDNGTSMEIDFNKDVSHMRPHACGGEEALELAIRTAHKLCAQPPLCAPLSKLRISCLHSQVLYALNASLVGLVIDPSPSPSSFSLPPAAATNSPTVLSEPPLLPCEGLGIVRAVDGMSGVVYLLTAIPLKRLALVNTLIRGALQLPVAFHGLGLLDENSVLFGRAPYITSSDDVLVSGAGSKHARPRVLLRKRLRNTSSSTKTTKRTSRTSI
mmetsp:Transcript_11759/g.19124  ORF Transcript_11759/g.19124 Transcript_11759/m.19124 type:complete len:755 (+) Transcript_11759:154-2418(+)